MNNYKPKEQNRESKLSELRLSQRRHLCYRLVEYLNVNMIVAANIAKGNQGDLPIKEVFERFTPNEYVAYKHVNQVLAFKLNKTKHSQ